MTNVNKTCCYKVMVEEYRCSARLDTHYHWGNGEADELEQCLYYKAENKGKDVYRCRFAKVLNSKNIEVVQLTCACEDAHKNYNAQRCMRSIAESEALRILHTLQQGCGKDGLPAFVWLAIGDLVKIEEERLMSTTL